MWASTCTSLLNVSLGSAMGSCEWSSLSCPGVNGFWCEKALVFTWWVASVLGLQRGACSLQSSTAWGCWKVGNEAQRPRVARAQVLQLCCRRVWFSRGNSSASMGLLEALCM